MRSSRDDRFHDTRLTIDLHQDTHATFTPTTQHIHCCSPPPEPHLQHIPPTLARRSHMLQNELLGIILSYDIVSFEASAECTHAKHETHAPKTHMKHAMETRLEFDGTNPSIVNASPQMRHRARQSVTDIWFTPLAPCTLA